MNSAQETAWATQDQGLDHMVPRDIDLSGLIDLDDLDVSNFNIPDPDPTAAHYGMPQSSTPFTDAMQSLSNGTAAHDFAQPDWSIPMDMDTGDLLTSHGGSHESLQNYANQMAMQSWQGTPQSTQSGFDNAMNDAMYRHPSHIPPTPNSYELHGADAVHLNNQRRAFLEQQAHHQIQMHQAKRDNNFTPLVSPAGTPQDSALQHPAEFAVPGTYFSPLTSPALQAQNAGQQFHTSLPPALANPALMQSPVVNDLGIDMFVPNGKGGLDRSRKSTKKSSTTRSTGSRSGVRQSPATKAQKRKSAALSKSISAQDLANAVADPQAQHLQNTLRTSTYATDSSGASISPEPLSEALMGPPPKPGTTSTVQSPTLLAQMQKAKQRLPKDAGAPATPASLMSIDNPKRAANGMTPLTGSGKTMPLADLDAAGLDDLILPPSAAVGAPATTPSMDGINGTPRISASRKTPKLGPLSTASSGRIVSSASSPAISALASPQSATTPTFGKDARMRNGKKRGSMSGGSALVSPALRPKISPSIKPLLPEGATPTDSQQALLLASKSNYTHLLEGTLLPGVSYPDSLSSGLTSKRTSHKIAEQGRRNRINEALKEMQSLLPPPALKAKQGSQNGSTSEKSDEHPSPDVNGDGTAKVDDEDDKASVNGDTVSGDGKDKIKAGKDKDKATSAASEAKAANSKAATVENAIEYIKALQKERVLLAEAMQARDSEVNDLRRKLRDAEFKLGGTASNSTTSLSPEANKSDT